jgi:transcriptional regulator with GAF, ATPase, and Fis domain
MERLLPDTSRPLRATLEQPRSERWTAAPLVEEPPTGIRKDGETVPLEIGFSVVSEGESSYLVASVTDITERLDLEAGLAAAREEAMSFQRLIGELIESLLSAEGATLDGAVTEGLGRVAAMLHLDMAAVWQTSVDGSTATPTHFWVRQPVPAPPDSMSTAALPWVVSRLKAGEPAQFSQLEDIPSLPDRQVFELAGATSGAAFPLPVPGKEGRQLRALCFASAHGLEWSCALDEQLQLVAAVVGQALAKRHVEAALRSALNEVDQLNAEVGSEIAHLRGETRRTSDSNSIVLESAAIKRAFKQVESVAPMPATVLLLGETGSGKEVFAQAIHDLSPRHHRPMVKVNCAAIPSALIESELFGRERGAYTGALSRQIGRFEVAHQSTLFLDEIGELPVDIQVKLLRALQHRVFERLGSHQSIKVDVRIIAATNKNLEKAVEDKTFREDLYYRLNVFPVVVPPLRERTDDIPGLVWAFIDEFSRAFGKPIESIAKESMRELQGYHWPGNVRELRNVIERAVIISTGRHLHVSLPKASPQAAPASMALADLEVAHIRAVLEGTNWRVRGAGGAAERLGLKPTTLESRMAKLGIRRAR